MMTPSLAPTSRECAAIGRHNSGLLADAINQHNDCLRTAPRSDSSTYRKSEPCSHVACRPIHLKMENLRTLMSSINQQCRELERKNKSEQRFREADLLNKSDNSNIQTWLTIDQGFSRASNALELVKNRDRPWRLIESVLGPSASASVRRKLGEMLSGGATQQNLDWQAYDMLVNRSIDANAAVARAGRNPLALLLGETALTSIYAVHANTLGQLDQSLAEMRTSFDVASSPDKLDSRWNRNTQKNTSLTHTSPNSSKKDDRCDILRDMRRSSALLESDPDTWDSLNINCKSP